MLQTIINKELLQLLETGDNVGMFVHVTVQLGREGRDCMCGYVSTSCCTVKSVYGVGAILLNEKHRGKVQRSRPNTPYVKERLKSSLVSLILW